MSFVRPFFYLIFFLGLVSCGGSDSPTDGANRTSESPQTPEEIAVDPVMSNSRLVGGWITSQGCGFDTGHLLITKGVTGAFTISILASGPDGFSNMSLYPVDITHGRYNSQGSIEYEYITSYRTSGFVYYDLLTYGKIALTSDGEILNMSSVCAQGVDYNALYTREGSSQAEHGARFFVTARALQDQHFQTYTEQRTRLLFELADRGQLGGSVAERRFAELAAEYLENLKYDLIILINQYEIIRLDRTYVESALEDLKQEDLRNLPDYQIEVQAMYDALEAQ